MKYYCANKLYQTFKGKGVFATEAAWTVFEGELDEEASKIQAEDSLLILWG